MFSFLCISKRIIFKNIFQRVLRAILDNVVGSVRFWLLGVGLLSRVEYTEARLSLFAWMTCRG